MPRLEWHQRDTLAAKYSAYLRNYLLNRNHAINAIEVTKCDRYSGGIWTSETTSVPREQLLTIFVNGNELATVMCTPVKVNFLAMGLLYSEGLIHTAKDVATMRVCDEEAEVDVRLLRQDIELPKARVLTSGCGGGSTSGIRDAASLRVASDVTFAPEQVTAMMKRLLEAAETHREYGGLHTSALCDGNSLTAVAEDIGRHNTLDKIAGECLFKSMTMHDRMLVSTGRMSSEMILKAGRMGTPVVVSRGALTGKAVSFADELGITAIGYARGERFTVYTHANRVGATESGLTHIQGR